MLAGLEKSGDFDIYIYMYNYIHIYTCIFRIFIHQSVWGTTVERQHFFLVCACVFGYEPFRYDVVTLTHSIHIHTYIYVYTTSNVYIYIYIYIFVCMHLYTCICMHIYVRQEPMSIICAKTRGPFGPSGHFCGTLWHGGPANAASLGPCYGQVPIDISN